MELNKKISLIDIRPIFYGLFDVYILHSLLKDGIPPGLADEQISPLHNHNTGKEGCVACELHNLSALIGLHQTRSII